MTTFLHEATGRRDLFPGGVLVPQTFGGLANWNPHVHGLLTDTCRDREGRTYPMPSITGRDLRGIEELFRSLVLKLLIDEEKLSLELADRMCSWRHSGFSVYRGGRFHPGLGRNFEVTDSLDWIARITSHIPRKGSKQVIYYGIYSHAWRGRERRQGILPTEQVQTVLPGEEKISFRSSRRRRMWGILLKRVWDIDALSCPRCGGRIRVISVIERPTVIRRILEHLDLWEEEPRPPLEMVCEPDADYVPWLEDVPEIEVG